jgi:RimJ/RimL family protein N-acetyltransferase
MDASPLIETERLVLRLPRADDASDLAVAYAEPETVRYIWDPETWEIGGSETEIGWLLGQEHWGHGYATEAALALRDWALRELGLTRLISLIQHGNVRSVRVAEKLGERYERDVEVRGKPSWLYALEA